MIGMRVFPRGALPWRRPSPLRWLVSWLAFESSPHMERLSTPALGEVAPNGRESPNAAVDRIYRQHARTVMAYLYHRLPSLADAEDALAEIFVAALTACAQGDAPGIGWLMTTARRRVADFYRRRGRGLHVLPLASAEQEQVAEPQSEPERVALRNEERRELLTLIAQLPDEQQEMLALRFASGLPSAEIAAIIGKSDEATRAILSRAVRRLRKEWGQ